VLGEEFAHNAAATMIADTNTPARSPGIRILLQIYLRSMLPQKGSEGTKITKK
jgi:hypothetical protein